MKETRRDMCAREKKNGRRKNDTERTKKNIVCSIYRYEELRAGTCRKIAVLFENDGLKGC